MLASKIKTALATATILATTAPALAVTVVVRPGTDIDTIQKAVDRCDPGDTIVLPRGVYDEDVTVNKADLTFVGKRAIWQSSRRNDCLNVTANGITITGITFRHGDHNVNVVGDDFTATRCIFIGATSNDSLDITGDRAAVDRCRFIGGADAAIEIDGGDATITRNYIAMFGEYGIDGSGDDSLVERNVIQTVEDEYGIEWNGDNCRFLRNRIVNTDSSAMYLEGDDLLVERNITMACGSIYVYGDDFRVLRNRCSYMVDDEIGINVDSDVESDPNGGGLVERNVIRDATQDGIHASGVKNVRILRNLLRGCGAEFEDAIYLEAEGTLVEGNRIFDCGGNGIAVWEGSGNEITGNLIRGCILDGLHIEGDANEVMSNRVFNNHGEGIDNGGTNTVCTGNSFFGNFLDVANDGSFVNFDAGNNRFRTGGETTAPVIDEIDD